MASAASWPSSPGCARGAPHRRVVLQIGRSLGTIHVTDRGRERRRRLSEPGHEIMRWIAELIDPDRREHHFDDPAIRAAAQGIEICPGRIPPKAGFVLNVRFERIERTRDPSAARVESSW